MAASRTSTVDSDDLVSGQPASIGKLPPMSFGRKAIFASLALLAGWAIAKLIRMEQRLREIRNMETRHNRTLKESFPASDPPASQYFDIPKNRL